MREIVADAAHRARAERLDPRGLQRVEHRPRVDIDRRDPGVKRGVMVAQPKRGRIRRPARFGDQLGFERRPRRSDARRLSRCRRSCRKRKRPRLRHPWRWPARAGERPEKVYPFGHAGACEQSEVNLVFEQLVASSRRSAIRAQALPTTLSGRSSPNTRW